MSLFALPDQGLPRSSASRVSTIRFALPIVMALLLVVTSVAFLAEAPSVAQPKNGKQQRSRRSRFKNCCLRCVLTVAGLDL
jgi:hypothetical protein